MKAYKKAVAILLAAITMLSLVGCGAKKNEAPAEDVPAVEMTDNAVDVNDEAADKNVDDNVIVDDASEDNVGEKAPQDWLIEIPVHLASDFVPLNDIPEDYTAEMAEEDGLVAYKDFEITANEALNNEFVKSLAAGVSDHIREAYFFEMFATEDGANKFTVVDKYCVDGIVVIRTNRGEFESEMRYYRLGEEEPDSESAVIDMGWTGYDNDPEKAAADGCLVIDGRKSKGDLRKDIILSGTEHWREFEADVEQGIPSAVRVARLSEGAAKKENITVYEVRFDGAYYYLAYYSEYDFGGGTEPCVTLERFEHLVKLEDAKNELRHVCALTHNEDITETPYEELMLISGVCYFVTPVDAGE